MPFRDRQISQEAFLRRAVDSRAIGDLQSDGFVSSTAASPAGWKIWKNGDAQFNNVTIIGDAKSGNWDGSTALSSTGPDPTASSGWFLDESAGIGQFQKIYAQGGEIDDVQVAGQLILGGTSGTLGTIRLGSSTGAYLQQAGQGWSMYSSTAKPFVVSNLYSLGLEMTFEAADLLSSTEGFSFIIDPSIGSPSTVLLVAENGVTIDGWLKVNTIDASTAAQVTFSTDVGITGTLSVSSALNVNDIITIGTGLPIIRSKTTDLILRAWSTSVAPRNLYLQTDDSGGVLRNRVFIDGDGETQLADKNAAERMALSTAGVAFWGQAPAARPNYTVSNASTDRAFDANTVATTELADVVGTIIKDLIAIGLFQ